MALVILIIAVILKLIPAIIKSPKNHSEQW